MEFNEASGICNIVDYLGKKLDDGVRSDIETRVIADSYVPSIENYESRQSNLLSMSGIQDLLKQTFSNKEYEVVDQMVN